MKILLLFILFPVFVLAQNEIKVNTFTDDNQRAPVIAGPDSEGNFSAVWITENQFDSISKKDIALKFFSENINSSNNELIVNDVTGGEQEFPALAINSSGITIVAWSSYNPEHPDYLYDIKAKLFEDGEAVTGEFLVNTTLTNSQTVPSVDISESGKFVIVWESWNQEKSGRSIYAQLFDENGAMIGEELLINQLNENINLSNSRPKVKYSPNGNFIVIWERWNETQKDYNIYGRVFDEDGFPLINEKMINTYTDNYQWFADLDVNSKNEIAIAWCSWEQDGYDGGIYLNKFDGWLNPLLSEQLVNNSKRFYQWLPKVKYLNDEELALLWSGWKTDGSREGIYYRLVKTQPADTQFRFLNQETRLNDFVEGYQWEPDFITKDEKIISVWSSWNQFGEMYDIVGKEFEPEIEMGILDSSEVKHTDGNTSSKIEVRIINSAAITNHQYEISFEGDEEIFMNVKDLDSDEIKVSGFPLNLGDDVHYATDEFDGIVLNIKPEFVLGLNEEKTIFVNRSNTNVEFDTKESSINKHLVPIDAMLLFGDTDTLVDGSYKTPLDTAFNQSLEKKIELPFRIQNFDYKPLFKFETIIFEEKENNKWDPGERIIIRTPEEFRENEFETFLEITSTSPENLVMPKGGDVIYIYMDKPLNSEDVFYFQVDSSKIILDVEEDYIADEYKLYQNFPNPFNPTTTIEFSIPQSSKVSLKIFDVLGQKVETLVNDFKAAGKYSLTWNPANISSGIYFYVLETKEAAGDNNYLIKKMIYLK